MSTTGIDRPGDRTSPFVRVHDDERIQARRPYMTATPRVCTDSSKSRAARHDVDAWVRCVLETRPRGAEGVP